MIFVFNPSSYQINTFGKYSEILQSVVFGKNEKNLKHIFFEKKNDLGAKNVFINCRPKKLIEKCFFFAKNSEIIRKKWLTSNKSSS